MCVCATTVVYQQRSQPQTVVVRDHRDRRSHGMGNMATGMFDVCIVYYSLELYHSLLAESTKHSLFHSSQPI